MAAKVQRKDLEGLSEPAHHRRPGPTALAQGVQQHHRRSAPDTGGLIRQPNATAGRHRLVRIHQPDDTSVRNASIGAGRGVSPSVIGSLPR
jgi:hypothetical protein